MKTEREQEVCAMADALASKISGAMPLERVELINIAREALHRVSPYKDHPCDFVRWCPVEEVTANDYNPNSVAAPEMRALRMSVENDGLTMPIVTCVGDEGLVVVDGFHRRIVATGMGMEHLPVTTTRPGRNARADHIQSTYLHNLARGRHGVDAMSQNVRELCSTMPADVIAERLHLDHDQVLRLRQIQGLAELFAGEEFSEAWDVG